ncbi:MAG: DNA adenine methylase [Ruminococcus sp.]|nr:DNA adenine methylase [Ruminococcus sp.]
MHYMGGKYSVRKPIAEIIRNCKIRGGTDTFVSLFCGALNVESEVAKDFQNVICNDKHKYLISMLQAVQNGFELPDFVSREEYYYIKEHKDEMPQLAGFVGFGCSFGGRWFQGYAKNARKHNYCAEAKRGLLRKLSMMPHAEFICGDYRDVDIPDGAIVYCDPPYAGVKRYSGTGEFDSAAFWQYVRELSKRCTVLVSETAAPEDFKSIWEQKKTRTLSNKQYFDVVEKVFVYNG